MLRLSTPNLLVRSLSIFLVIIDAFPHSTTVQELIVSTSNSMLQTRRSILCFHFPLSPNLLVFTHAVRNSGVLQFPMLGMLRDRCLVRDTQTGKITTDVELTLSLLP